MSTTTEVVIPIILGFFWKSILRIIGYVLIPIWFGITLLMLGIFKLTD